MATFTTEELQDQDRVELGYDRFEETTVPFGLEPGYGSLKKAIASRDHFYGTSTPKRFSILDGVGVAASGQPSAKAVEFLEKLVGGQVVVANEVTPGEILDRLIEKSKQPESQGQAMFYLLTPDKSKILGVVHIQDERLTFDYVGVESTFTQWEQTEFENINANPENSINFDTQGRSEDVLFRIEFMLGELELEKVAEPDFSLGGYTSKWNVVYLEDGGLFRDELLADLGASTRERTLQDPKARELCLMMTADWLEPAFEFSDNIPNWRTLETFVDSTRIVEGNCVEQSIANAINHQGGLNGQFVNPRFRVLPSQRALTQPVPIFHLDDIDPFSEQTLSRRLFGVPSNIDGVYEIENQGIGEAGATVQVAGHEFFARRDGDVVDVYDTAMRFCGPSNLYENYLEMSGLPTSVKSVSHCTEIDKSRSNFFDVCRQPYRDKEVYARTKEIFQGIVPSERDMDDLYSAWNQALGERPELIYQALGIEGNTSGTELIEKNQGGPKVVDSQTIDDLLLTQDNGFACLKWVPDDGVGGIHFILFKKGDDIFFSAGRDGCPVSIDAGEIFGNQDGVTYEVTSFGGNDIDLMRSVCDAGVQHHIDNARQSNQSPNAPSL
jgi:hypothetical protein